MSDKLKRIHEVTAWHSKLEPCKCYLCFMLNQLALSTEREVRFRKALEEVKACVYLRGNAVVQKEAMFNIARTALNEGKDI